MPAKSFTKDGNQIRQLKSGCYVLEDEWELYTKTNEVCPSTYSGCGTADMGLGLALIVHAQERTF